MKRQALAILLLSVLALPAAAQPWDDPPEYRDREDVREAYRRGYERGFERGFEKGRREGERGGGSANAPSYAPPPPPPNRPTGPIYVNSAFYGDGSRTCDATRWVRSRANGKRSASIDVSNNMCGDPARGSRKQLEVAYTCGHLAKSASAYEHRSVYLDCN